MTLEDDFVTFVFHGKGHTDCLSVKILCCCSLSLMGRLDMPAEPPPPPTHTHKVGINSCSSLPCWTAQVCTVLSTNEHGIPSNHSFRNAVKPWMSRTFVHRCLSLKLPTPLFSNISMEKYTWCIQVKILHCHKHIWLTADWTENPEGWTQLPGPHLLMFFFHLFFSLLRGVRISLGGGWGWGWRVNDWCYCTAHHQVRSRG